MMYLFMKKCHGSGPSGSFSEAAFLLHFWLYFMSLIRFVVVLYSAFG